MHPPIQSINTIQSKRSSIGQSGLRRSFVVITLASAWVALLPAPKTFGVTPAPDGAYAGDNTAEGAAALFSLTGGLANTAIGSYALYQNTDGLHNTATGYHALQSNITGNDNTAIGAAALFDNTTGNNK